MASSKRTPQAGPQPPEADPGIEDGDPTPPATAATGPSQGELDEAMEDNLNLKAENARLQSTIEEMNQRMARLERIAMGGKAYERPSEGVDRDTTGQAPVFDEEGGFGTIWGDSEVAYFQNGHYFGPDKLHVRSDPPGRAGSPRAFKPQLVGLVVRVTAKAA